MMILELDNTRPKERVSGSLPIVLVLEAAQNLNRIDSH